MEFKFSLKWSLFVIGIVAIIFSSIIILSPGRDSLLALSGKQVNLKAPIRLKIPSLNIDALIEFVGLTSEGAMDVPKGPDGVAWFDLGPRPGEIGSAVMAGHSGYKNNRPAVFDNLSKLQKGDKIYVEDETGTVITFIVRESREYNPDTYAKDVFGSSDGKAHLNLITCTGTWNNAEKTHSLRLVVFTDKEIEL